MHIAGTVYFASAETVVQHAQLVQRLLNGLVAGWDRVYADYATSVPIIISFDEQRLTSDYVRFALDRQREYLRPIAARHGEFNDAQWRALQTTLTQRLRERTVDLAQAVNYDFLREAYRKPLTFGE